MSESNQVLPKAKKSVALSGTAAGNTAICTVGRTGNDLHYRGYDILDFAETAEFEEIAYLLIHGHLPTPAELTAYKAKLKSMRGLPLAVKQALEAIPASAHPMYRLLRDGKLCPREGRPSGVGSAGHHRSADGQLRLRPALLVPLRHEW